MIISIDSLNQEAKNLIRYTLFAGIPYAFLRAFSVENVSDENPAKDSKSKGCKARGALLVKFHYSVFYHQHVHAAHDKNRQKRHVFRYERIRTGVFLAKHSDSHHSS